jgi:hypothetical protein
MPALARRPRTSALAPLVAIALMACLASDVLAQSASLYGLNDKGQLTVNATVLDSLNGSKWVDLVVMGSDRYALRDDGRVDMNGLKIYKIECEDGNGNDVNEGLWVALAWRDGSLWALSARGYLAKDGVCAAKFDQGDFLFTDLFAGDTAGSVNTWSLRSDGAAYVNTIAGVIFQFEGNPGLDPKLGEGEASDTMWMSGAVKKNGNIFAMRRDGTVVVGTFLGGGGTPFSGTIAAELPFGNTANTATLYADLVFRTDDKWIAIRGNGKTYSQDNTLTAFIEFNGNSSGNQIYVDLLALPVIMGTTTDMSFFALRKDGKLYRETGVAAVAQLPKSGYGKLAVSMLPPDLTNAKNALPAVTTYGPQAVTGTPFSVPILATDTDKLSEDLIVTVTMETLPKGATYDPMTRMISWDSPVKGKAKIKIEVDDGVGKPVKKTFKVNVRDPPSNPDKNVKPRSSKIKGTQALVGFEIRIPIQASDQNGDDLTYSVDETQEPFTLGATFDAKTATFIWSDPELAHIGSYTMQFMISDGIATVKRKVKVNLVSSFLGF